MTWTVKQLRSMRQGQIRDDPRGTIAARSKHSASEADQASWLKLGRSVNETLDILNGREP